jgi:pyrophosphate--fructose-6-phosphate 1-phosphotransferase
MENKLSPVAAARAKYQPRRAAILSDLCALTFDPVGEAELDQEVAPLFPATERRPIEKIGSGASRSFSPLKVGVVFSGGQAPGGHNVIWGLFDALQALNADSTLFGFVGGPSGICSGQTLEITEQRLATYRNQGGFDMIASGRTKIETPEQFAAAEKTARDLDLDGIVIIGGDDSNTNAALLAEHFAAAGLKTRVAGVPKTIDGDLKTEYIEASFGFHTACSLYSELIGNIAKDVLSAKKYTHFIKLMGRSASHIALECALATQPNVTLISEEIAANNQSLKEIVGSLVDTIEARAECGKNYGIILIPEGIIEFIPEMKQLISELNTLLSKESDRENQAGGEAVVRLSSEAKRCFTSLPTAIQQQLLLDRDPHGNVKVAQIESEKLLIEMCQTELKRRNSGAKFSPLAHYFGYEGRAALPTNFDADYCYNLGLLSGALIAHGKSGSICAIKNLRGPVCDWQPYSVPITSMLHLEMRKGKQKPVIEKALVDLEGSLFKSFAAKRKELSDSDAYIMPGPIQLFGPEEICDMRPAILEA